VTLDELPVLPFAAELPALLVEPVLPVTLDELPVLPLAAELPALLVEPVLPATLDELPVLPFAAELPALLVEPVLPTRLLPDDGAPVLAPVDPVLSPVPVPPEAVLGALFEDVPVLVPVDGAEVVSCPCVFVLSSPLPPLCRSPLESELPSPGSLCVPVEPEAPALPEAFVVCFELPEALT